MDDDLIEKIKEEFEYLTNENMKLNEMNKKLIDEKNKKALLDLIKNGIPNCMRREIYLFLLNHYLYF